MTLWWNKQSEITVDAITFDKASLARDPDAYLAASEAGIAKLRSGLAKQIVWHDAATKARTPYCLIYLHGFSASSGEIRPVPDLVARHLKANLYFARLNGHGADGEAMGQATIEDWIADVAEAIAIGERIGERVIIMATSTGAALATWALTQPALAGNVAAAILLSANYALQARGAFLLFSPFARQLVRLIVGRTRSFEPVNAEHARLWTHSYSSKALLPMAAAIRLANQANVETTTVPVLFIHSPHDKVIDPTRIRKVAERWGAPHRLVAMDGRGDPSAHVLAGAALAPANTRPVTRLICEWLDSTLPAR